ncbi:MAG: hypothetical protein L6R40_006654 [Gallowayella cf. fulva]|nr:MAG: hypothetical protein L6R40_006654 [Xanthomendoza cf. fulva]
MVDCLGRLPQHWWKKWHDRAKFFNEDGSWKAETGRAEDPAFTATEAKSLEKMLKTMLEYEPTKRATVNDVVDSQWMRAFALPSLQKFTILVLDGKAGYQIIQKPVAPPTALQRIQ